MEKNEPTTVLHVENLRVYLETPRGDVHAVDDVSLEVRRGEAVALVGESGCGKSMTAMSILRLAPSPPAKVLGGTIRLHDDVDILTLSQVQVQRRRGSAAGMMFQDPSTYLNPALRTSGGERDSRR